MRQTIYSMIENHEKAKQTKLRMQLIPFYIVELNCIFEFYSKLGRAKNNRLFTM